MNDYIDLSIVQIDYEEEKSDQEGRKKQPVMHVFGRTASNELRHVRVLNHRPYFYVPTSEVDSYETTPEQWFDCVMETELHDPETGDRYTSIRGVELTRIYTELPRDVAKIRDEFDNTFEADILFPNRMMIDHGLHSGIRVPDDRGPLELEKGMPIECDIGEIEAIDFSDGEMRIHQMDIEVNDRNGFPKDGEEPIICLTSWDSYREEYILWMCEAPDSDEEYPDSFDYEPLKGEIDLDVRVFEEEDTMLAEYLDYIDETDPDLYTGWNFADFDMPYVMDRLDVLNRTSSEILDKKRLSRTGTAYYKSGNFSDVTLKGRIVFDLLDGYKSMQFSEMESYRLEYVGQQELGAGKETYTGKIGDLWEDDPLTLYQYSVRDVELTVELDSKETIIDFWHTASNIAGCFIEEAPTANEIVDMYVLQKVYGNMILPSKGVDDYENYEGGAVFDPIKGVKEWVTVTDLKSLYPMCMSTLNLSPETHVPNPDEYDGDTYRSPPIPARGGERLHFRKEPDGIIREIIDELLSERDAKKAERNQYDPKSDEYARYNRQQAAIKVIMNSTYGVLGWERFRLYDKDMGAAVTAAGRGVIEFTEQIVEEMGFSVTYGDTDSVMISIADWLESLSESGELAEIEIRDEVKEGHPDMDDQQLRMLQAAIDKSFEFEETINTSYDEYAADLNAQEHRFEMEFEKLYRRFFQAGKKKRYAGHIIWKEGKFVDDVDITGFEYERSDVAPFTRETQKEVLDRITRGDEEDVKEYVHERLELLKTGDVSLDEIGIPQGIGKKLSNYENPDIRVKSALWANLMLGRNFKRGDKPKCVYLERVNPRFFHKIERRRKRELEKDDLYRDFKRRAAAQGNDKSSNKCAICFDVSQEVPDDFVVDWETMVEKAFRGPIERILVPLGISWSECENLDTQSGLDQWT